MMHRRLPTAGIEVAPHYHQLLVIPTLYEGDIVSVHRIVMENRPVDPGSIQESHRPISFILIKHRTRANDVLCKTEY